MHYLKPLSSIIKGAKAVSQCFDVTNTIWENQVPIIFLMRELKLAEDCFHTLVLTSQVTAKGVLQYLVGSLRFSLEYGLDSSVISLPVQDTVQGCILTDADYQT